MNPDKPKIFLCYAHYDEKIVLELYQNLINAGFFPWIDIKDIIPGEHWEYVIEKAIEDASFFLVCLSNNSVKRRGIIQVEIKKALDVWQQKLPSDIYLIPVSLEICEVPKELAKFQRVDLFEKNGFEQLVNALKAGMERLGIKYFQPKVVSPMTGDGMMMLLHAFDQTFWSYREDSYGDNYGIESSRLNKNLVKIQNDLVRGNPTTPRKIRSFLIEYNAWTPELEDIVTRFEKMKGLNYSDTESLDFSEYLEY